MPFAPFARLRWEVQAQQQALAWRSQVGWIHIKKFNRSNHDLWSAEVSQPTVWGKFGFFHDILSWCIYVMGSRWLDMCHPFFSDRLLRGWLLVFYIYLDATANVFINGWYSWSWDNGCSHGSSYILMLCYLIAGTILYGSTFNWLTFILKSNEL